MDDIKEEHEGPHAQAVELDEDIIGSYLNLEAMAAPTLRTRLTASNSGPGGSALLYAQACWRDSLQQHDQDVQDPSPELYVEDMVESDLELDEDGVVQPDHDDALHKLSQGVIP